MIEIGILAWICMMAMDKGSNVSRKKRGGGGTKIEQAPAPAAAPTASDTAEDIYQARLKYDPKIQQQEFDLMSQYLPQYTQQYYDTRQDVFSNEAQVADQLRQNTLSGLQDPSGQMGQTLGLTGQLQTGLDQLDPEGANLQNVLQNQILQNLQSPTGLTPDQTSAQDAVRQREMDRLTEGLRTRANLGGGLFGGRAAGTEERARSEMGQAYATEDIDRQERSRMSALQNAMLMASQNQAQQQSLYGTAGQQQLNAMQAAYPYLQMLYPEVGMVTPQFQSAVPTPNAMSGQAASIYGSQAGMYNTSLQAQAQQNAARQAMIGQMVGGVAQGVGSFAGMQWGNKTD